jgi:PAS domain S-box-containing protein
VTLETKTLVLNAAPLFVLGVAYAAVSAAILPTVWRLRGRATAADVTVASVFPIVAAAGFVYGGVVLQERSPFAGHLWLSFAVLLAGLVPPLLFFARLAQAGDVSGGERMHAAETAKSRLEGELSAVTELSGVLAAAESAEDVARTLVDRTLELVGLEYGAVLEIDDEQREATGVFARSSGAELDWFPGVRLDLLREPSGTASAVFDGAPVSIYDASSSLLVNRPLTEKVDAKSIIFVPLIAEGRVLAVFVLASTSVRRVLSSDELALVQSLANDAALAFARVRSSSALAKALERERLIGRISGKFRTQLDLQSILSIAVRETARALGAQRAFVRLGESRGEMPIAAEWHEDRLSGIGAQSSELPISNLALRERRTVTVADIETDARLRDPLLGDVDVLRRAQSRAGLSTPIIVFDELIGAFTLHRSEPGEWSPADVSVAEAVAGEVGLAVHIAKLLAQNEERLREQSGLLRAAQAVTAELELERVLQRLVDEVAALLSVDAADLYLHDAERHVLRCAAVHGLPEELLGFEFTTDRGLAAKAIERGEPVASASYEELEAPIPNAAYAGFTDALVAPVAWSGEIRGVLGVGARGDRTFDDRDTEVIGAFASLAALALRNAETFEERSRQARVQQGFYRVAAILGEPLSVAETLDAAAQAATEALGGSFAAVLEPRADGVLALAGRYELPERIADALEDGVPSSSSVLALCADERRVIASSTLSMDARFDAEWKELLGAAGSNSLLAVPLESARDDSCGVVLVCFEGEHRFSDDDLELARSFARAARGALQRSESFEAERGARALAQELARTGSLLATELDPDAVLDEVVQRAPTLIGADACAIRLAEGDELVVTAVSGPGTDGLVAERSPVSGRLSGDVFQSAEPVALANAATDTRHLDVDAVLAGGFVAYLGVPLVGPEGTVHGVLSLYASHPRAWREEEIAAVAALAGNTAAALSNAELYTSVALDRERSAAILGNIADGIVAVDRDGNVVLWNPAAERITGVAAGEAVGRAIRDVLQRDLESEGEEAGRLVSIGRGSEEVWLSLTEAVMRDPTGAVAGRIYAFRDISADRLVEEMKNEFVATVSHELRGPLTSIYGFAETLLRQDIAFGEDEQRTFLGYIASESERLTSIVDALLNVARLTTGDLQVSIAPTDVGALLSEVVAGVHEPMANGHRFVLDVPSEPLAANADPDKLRQVVAALVDNAIKFSPGGGTVTVAVRRADDAVAVSVEDEGVGIPKSEQERIFRKFYRAGDATQGTGVGLFIAQGLVTAMGGRISVSSEEGKGSQFTFELPLAPGAVVQEQRPRV